MNRLIFLLFPVFLQLVLSYPQKLQARAYCRFIHQQQHIPIEIDSSQVKEYYNKAKEIYRSDPKEAQNIVEKGISLAQLHHMSEMEVDLLNLKGVILLKLNQFDESIKTHFEVLKKREALQDKKGEMLSLLNIGNVFNKSYDPDQALIYYLKSLKIAQQINDAPNRTNIQLNIGNIYAQRALNGTEQKPANKAIEYLLTTVAYSKKNTPQIDLFNSYILLSYLYLKVEKFNLSSHYTDIAVDITSKKKDPVGESYARINRANILVQEKKFELAKREVSIIKQIIARSGLKELNEEFSGDFEKIAKAIKMSNTALVLSDIDSASAESTKNSELIRTKIREELREKYETTKKELENKNLKLHNEAIEKEVKWNRSAWLWTCGFLLIFSVLLLLLYNKHKLLILEKRKVEFQSHEIEKQHASLIQADHFRSRIFSVISHDLRTPIANFNALLSLTKIASIPESEIKSSLVSIGQEVKTASKMLEELLVWSSQQMSNEQIEFATISIYDTVMQSVQLFEDRIRLKKLTVVYYIDKNITVYTDGKRLEFIIRNMINNAIKFSFIGKPIKINAKEQNGEVIIAIEDQGSGIDEIKLAALRRKGRIFSTLGTLEEKGTGIGLMLSQEFAERIGCRISISSTIGLGSIFSLHVPM